MARVDDMSETDTNLYNRGFREAWEGKPSSPDEGYSKHYWQGFVMGRLARGWEKCGHG